MGDGKSSTSGSAASMALHNAGTVVPDQEPPIIRNGATIMPLDERSMHSASWVGPAGTHEAENQFASSEVATSHTEPQKETPIERRVRRLARFRSMGGELRQAGTSWHVKGPRGVLKRLSAEERTAGHPRNDQRDVKKELVDALEAEMRVQRGS